MQRWADLRTGTKVAVILVAVVAVLLNAWNHGGTVFSAGVFYGHGIPFIFYREHPTLTGEDWDFDHMKVYFSLIGLLLNLLFWAVVVWVSKIVSEWLFVRDE